MKREDVLCLLKDNLISVEEARELLAISDNYDGYTDGAMAKKKYTVEETVDHIMSEVDESVNFENVYNYMDSTGWKWGASKSSQSIDEMRDTVRDMVRKCITNLIDQHNGGDKYPISYCSSGGFDVFVAMDDDGYDDNGPGFSVDVKFSIETGGSYIYPQKTEG